MTRTKLQRGLTPLSLALLGGVCFAAACSSGSDTHSPPISAAGGTSGANAGSSSGGTRHSGGSSGSSSKAGSSSANGGLAGENASNGDAGAGGDQPGTVVDVTPGACSETALWAGAAPLAGISTTDAETLLSITSDELDIAFLRGGALYLAHRALASDDFAAAAPVTLPKGYAADAGAALSADGKTLVLVSTDGASFASLTRASRTANFGTTADPTAFLALNARAIQTLEHFAAPVLAPDGKSFVFTGFTPGAAGMSVVYESLWSVNQWAMPGNISMDLFNGTGDKRPLPSGLSSDSRTLFYFDEATSKEVARFRDRPDAPLYDTVDLGGLAGAAPNAKCDRLYYSSAGNVLTESD